MGAAAPGPQNPINPRYKASGHIPRLVARREVAMNRCAFASPLALLLCTALTSSVFAQAKPAAPTAAPAPPAKAKFATPVKGEVAVQVIQGRSAFVGKEIVTKYQIKNMASGPIALLKIDEYWYDKDGKMVSTDTQRYKQPFQPGEVIELTTRAPAKPGAARSQATFSHANGKVVAKAVKKFQ
jgi:hypothetical protein